MFAIARLGRVFSLGSYLFTLARKSGLFASVIAGVLATSLLSWLFSYVVIDENESFKLVYTLGFLRNFLVVTVVIFVINFVSGLRNRGEFLALLSLNLSRAEVVMSFVSMLLAVVLSVVGLSFLIVLFFGVSGNFFGFCIWFCSLFFELLILSLLSVFISFGVKSDVLSVFFVMMFYIISRLASFFIAVIEKVAGFKSVDSSLDTMMLVVSIIFPRFDLFSKTEWVLYAEKLGTMDIVHFVLQGVVYLFLLWSMLIFDFRKREF